MRILGDYAITTFAETFMKRNNDSLTNDIARLRGIRFVTTTETEQGKRLSEHLIRQAPGNDQLTARFLYGSILTFCQLSRFLWLNPITAPRQGALIEQMWNVTAHNKIPSLH
jgi:phage/plasmid-associated DNA primase